jgi:hypothetical protein
MVFSSENGDSVRQCTGAIGEPCAAPAIYAPRRIFHRISGLAQGANTDVKGFIATFAEPAYKV